MPKLPRDVDAAFVYLHACQVVEADHVRLVDRQRKVVEVERHPALPPADPTQRQTVTHSAPELHARLAEERPQGKPPAALPSSYHPTGFPWFCRSSHATSGAK